jgi:hypothetical protein
VAAQSAEVLANPLHVVIDLIAASESSLSRASIEAVVVGVAGGRTKRRRLAQTLQEHPSLLRDGRSPAPVVVGNLLIALRKAGAVAIAAPVCTDCGKALPSLQRRGNDWYCGVCGPKPEPCAGCRQRRARCAICGKVRLVRGGARTEPRCAICIRPASFWHTCPECGEHTQHRSRRCARCSLRQRLGELCADNTGKIHPQLQALYDNLANQERPGTVAIWLNKDTASAVLRELAAGQRALIHAGLDELPDSKPIKHLRAVLVATGALPPRDEHLVRLELWITATIADHAQKLMLRHYGIWHAMRRLRRRNNGQHATYAQTVCVQRNLKAAIALLDWLTARGLDLATARQGDLDTWLTSDHLTQRRDAGNFVRWAKAQKLTRLEFAAIKWHGPSGVIDPETRWDQARHLLHDDTIRSDDRVAGLLVLLYAQTPATISRLTLNHVQTDGHDVRLRLGREPIVLPEPLAPLVLQLITSRHGHAALGNQGNSPWLFPGGQPGRPLSAYQLGERLRQLGLHPGQARSTALFQLATELPAALLARLLEIHISVAVAWQHASSSDWASYAADNRQPPITANHRVTTTRRRDSPLAGIRTVAISHSASKAGVLPTRRRRFRVDAG